MKSVFKYKLEPKIGESKTEPVTMPVDAKYLHVGFQGEDMYLWAEVDTDLCDVYHTFEVFGTGHEMSDESRNFIGTAQLNNYQLVFHIYSNS